MVVQCIQSSSLEPTVMAFMFLYMIIKGIYITYLVDVCLMLSDIIFEGGFVWTDRAGVLHCLEMMCFDMGIEKTLANGFERAARIGAGEMFKVLSHLTVVWMHPA